MMLVGISGKAHSGKTTLGNALADLYGCNHLSLASVLKDKARAEFGLTEEQVNGSLKEMASPFMHSDDVTPLTNREVLIRLGLGYRSIDKDYWLKQLFLEKSRVNVISDVRFKNEAAWIKERGGLLVRLERAIEQRGFELDDKSETDLDDYTFDLRIPESSNCDMQDIASTARKVFELVCSAYTPIKDTDVNFTR